MSFDFTTEEIRVLTAIVQNGTYDDDNECITLPLLRDGMPISLRRAEIEYEVLAHTIFITDDRINDEFPDGPNRLPVGLWDASTEIQAAFLKKLFACGKTFTAKNKKLANEVEKLAGLVGRQTKIL
jgi:hypothetical protein